MAKGLNRKNRKGCNVPEQPTVPKIHNIRHLEKKTRVYVVADPESGQYLYKKPGYTQYHFVKDIAKSTKTEDRSMALFLIQCYKDDTRDNLDLVVIPLEITYELINESCDNDYMDEIATEIMGRTSEWEKKLN